MIFYSLNIKKDGSASETLVSKMSALQVHTLRHQDGQEGIQTGTIQPRNFWARTLELLRTTDAKAEVTQTFLVRNSCCANFFFFPLFILMSYFHTFSRSLLTIVHNECFLTVLP